MAWRRWPAQLAARLFAEPEILPVGRSQAPAVFPVRFAEDCAADQRAAPKAKSLSRARQGQATTAAFADQSGNGSIEVVAGRIVERLSSDGFQANQ